VKGLTGRAIRGRLARGLCAEEGTAMVEFAVCSLVLVAMLFTVLQVGLIFFDYNVISEAAREGARWAVVRGSTSCANTPNLTDCDATGAEIQSYVQGVTSSEISSTNLSVTTTWLTATSSGSPATTSWATCSTGTCNAPGNAVNVKITYPFHLIVPPVTVTTISMSSASQMIISQ
jgi:Flp pilus assembly protein TadG